MGRLMRCGGLRRSGGYGLRYRVGWRCGRRGVTGDPKAIVVRGVFAEPYVVRGDVVIREQLDEFVEGLEVLNRLGWGVCAD